MFPTTQNSITDLSSALAQSKVHHADKGSAGKAFLKFNFKDGGFTFGRDQVDITDEEIVVNVATFAHGWTLWVNGTPQKVMRSFVEDLPAPMPSVDGNQPSESRGFEARFPEEDDDTILVFETNSFGGRKGADKLLSEVSVRSEQGEEEYLYPVVRLTSENYKSKQGSTIFNPVFEVVGWVNQAGKMQDGHARIAQAEQEEPEAGSEETPIRRRRRA